MKSLPLEHFMEATAQAHQRKITLESLDLVQACRPDVQVFNELLVQYYDPDTKSFVFYAGGRTLRYDPGERVWTGLLPKTHSEKELGGVLLWGSMCDDRHNKRFVLFGGGNVQSERGAPGAWTYTPATNTW